MRLAEKLRHESHNGTEQLAKWLRNYGQVLKYKFLQYSWGKGLKIKRLKSAFEQG